MLQIRKKVFHYTGIDSAISIINDKKILCNSVKMKFIENKDFINGEYISPILKRIMPEKSNDEALKIFDDLICPAILILIKTSYLFSSTNCYGSNYHWKKYSNDNGCCLKIATNPLKQHEKYLQDGKVLYKDTAFKKIGVENFIRHCLSCKVKQVSDKSVRAFIKAITFSKYADHKDDNEHRFLYGNIPIINIEGINYINKQDEYISSLLIPIFPEIDIEQIYFKSESRKCDFLEKITNNQDAWVKKTSVLSEYIS